MYIYYCQTKEKGKNILMNGCFLFKDAKESYNYILLWYPLKYKLLNIVYRLLEISWVTTHDEGDKI